ncbi:two-component system sensor histidine kinase RegB [Sphingomonas kaistensis]|uniref:histidine kinase n=1 Tax=Sphingomonas kaistensis TaxID=298708 RepID=A0A7X6BFL8_9SPHN|nr:ATP-binding protein [Sphingomonas kaistensis]NJC05529.1 two-component system sensor histidine kinase RegB [Sphingomonas kaistensis]
MDVPLLALTNQPSRLPGRSPQEAVIENMRLLIQLRWIAVAGQLVAILVAHLLLDVTLPLAAMLSVAGLLALGNLLFTFTLRERWVVPGELFLALLLDMAALTAQLYLSGGVRNPFVSLYLLQIVLGAVLLPAGRAWLLVGVSIAAFIFLALRHLPLNLPPLGKDDIDLFLIGEEIAFVMVAILLVLFTTRISRNLRARDAYVAELRQRAAEEDSIVRMGLFASGAAHELGTPLSSLSVLVGDWQRMADYGSDPHFREELADARRAVERCREIVSDILDTSGLPRGEAMASLAAEQLLEGLVADWTALHEEVPLDASFGAVRGARIPGEPALRQALWSLLENAGEASPSGIVMRAEATGDQLVVHILDDGPGFAPEQIAALGQALRSAKGAGHGLGLFLASSVARRLGGSLDAGNRPEGGASVRFALPLVGSERSA